MNSVKHFPVGCITEVYEYKDYFWVIEKSFQVWPDEGGPTERVALAGSLPVPCTSKDIGDVCIKALLNFNSQKPPYKPWELTELRKLFCSWVGVKNWNSFYKNARYIWVIGDNLGKVEIIPVDNCNLFPYETGINDSAIYVDNGFDSEGLGSGIFKAFKYATNHPDRKK